MNRVYGMPRRFARSFKASSSDCGTRILICAAFGSNSKRMGLKAEKSYSDRSAVSTNLSASSSVSKRGKGFLLPLIIFYFLPMHVAGADAPDEPMARFLPDREYHEDVASGSVPPDSIKTGFSVLRIAIGKNKGIAPQRVLDFRLLHAVFAAFRPISPVPVKSRNMAAAAAT